MPRFNILRCSRRYLFLYPNLGKSYYEILGVPPNATYEEIKLAYYKQCWLHHPDRNKGSKVASANMKKINNAYEVLRHWRSRKIYDKTLLMTHLFGDQEEDNKMRNKEEFNEKKSKSDYKSSEDWSKSGYYEYCRRAEEYKKKQETHKESVHKESQKKEPAKDEEEEQSIADKIAATSLVLIPLIICIASLYFVHGKR